jgi:predicted DNA binding CopG/RHH family protein
MKKNYDFSKAIKNPYAKRLKKQVTIRLNSDAIAYFKELAEEVGVPYQTLIDLYLRDCAAKRRKLFMQWKASA